MYHLSRFLEAQERDYSIALEEIQNGCKISHWIWFIFPQVKGLGVSSTSDFYGIKNIQEAKEYIANPILNAHLREITTTLLSHVGKFTVWEIFGTIDAMKVRSCMTLFDLVSPNDIYAQVLHEFYNDEKCKQTVTLLNQSKQTILGIIYNQIFAHHGMPKT